MEFLPEDIVVDIIARLPIKDLFRLKCISSRYKSLVSCTKFGRTYLQSWSGWSALLCPFVNSFPDEEKTIPSLYSDHKVAASSNGLVVSYIRNRLPSNSHAFRHGCRFGLRVSNPLSKQSVHLPEPITVSRRIPFEAALATRHTSGRQQSAFLTYKVVLIARPIFAPYPERTNVTVEIFSSDTGKWVSRNVRFPGERPQCGPWADAAYNGILYRLDPITNVVITYDPFDSPDKFSRIELPGNRTSGRPEKFRESLIHCGDLEMPRYCELSNILSVWRLDKGEWFVEAKIVLSAGHLLRERLLLPPHLLKHHIIIDPCVLGHKFLVIDSPLGIHKYVNLSYEADPSKPSFYRLLLVQFCPWSSPSF